MSSHIAQLTAELEKVDANTRATWKQAFDAFDADKSGKINAKELSDVVLRVYGEVCPGDIESMIASVDHDQDKMVSLQEFELMMVTKGGFSHIVRRHIRMRDVASLLTAECIAFVECFCSNNAETFAELKGAADASLVEKPGWCSIFKRFVEEAELTLLSAATAWGVSAGHESFEPEFLDAVMHTELHNEFLRFLEYGQFLRRMRKHVSSDPVRGSDGDRPGVSTSILRPMTPHSSNVAQQRLAKIDRELALIDVSRNALIAERRRLIGCEVTPIVTSTLKQQLEAKHWKEDVGLD